MVRISTKEISKKGSVPTNGSIFFTIFQTFMSGADFEGRPAPYFGEYSSDYFDFIVIDKCHRGGANDEGNWRGILEYWWSNPQRLIVNNHIIRKELLCIPAIPKDLSDNG